MNFRRFIVGLIALICGGFVAFGAATHRDGPASYYPPAGVSGVLNPAVTQATIGSTICVSGWTATIRPPSNYTSALKKQQMAQYGLVCTNGCEEDHFVSLELGGSPTDVHNLWPESYPEAHQKDHVENLLHAAVCSNAMTLKQAQTIIISDWYAYYRQHVASPSFGSIVADPDDE